MLGFLLLIVFAVFAYLMFARILPALLAIPMMAVAVAALVGLPFRNILSDIIAAGSTRLAAAYIAVFAGAMLGRVMIGTGIAEGIIKRAAEFGGERPMIVAGALMIVTALLFTSLTGLGAIIMVGSLVLPVMMSLGLPRKLAGVLFLLAFATGFIFNPALLRILREVVQLAPNAPLPAEVGRFGVGLLVITTIVITIYAVIESRRSATSFWAVKTKGEVLADGGSQPNGTSSTANRRVPFISFLTPFVPLVLFYFFGWSELPAFLGGALFGVLTTSARNSVKQLSAAVVRGVEDGAPAAILLIGIGMLLNALNLPAVKGALAPIVTAIPLDSPISYVLFFGLLSPLALYRGPLNPFGVGIGVFSIMNTAGVLPALALMAAIMSVVQVQNVCDPTNTQNVWVANYTGVRVEEITKATLLTMMIICFGGLILGAWMFLI